MLIRKFLTKGCSSNIYKVKASIWLSLFYRIHWINQPEKNTEIISKVYNQYKELYYREVYAMRKMIGYPTVCQLMGISSPDHTLYMERGEYDMYNYITHNFPFTPDTIHNIISRVVDCVLDCHKNNIAHLDIKPENIIFRKKGDIDSICLIDFNSSTDMDSPDTIILTTKSYRPPSIKLGRKYMPDDYRYIDYWQVGVLAYILFTKHIPIGKINWKPFHNLPKNIKEFISSLITHQEDQADLSTIQRPYW
jgi:serine/threonine protein kinase